MATSVTMPQLGESVTEGTVTRWLKQVGDTVSADEPLLEVSTDKVDTEIPSPVPGVLTEIRAQEDEVIEVGGELAVIADSSPSHVISWSIRRPTEEQISIPSTTQRSPLVCCMASLSRIRFLVIRCNFTRVRVFISRSPAVSERLTFL